MPISEDFATWIRDSWSSTKQPPCWMALHISERFAAWKRDSWASANQPHCWTVLLIFERFAPWKRYSWASTNRPFAGWYCSYLNVSQPENAIPDNHQIDPLAVWHKLYLNLFAAWKQNSWISADQPPTRTALPIFERSEAWKRDSWESANRCPFMTALHTFGRFTTWLSDSWASEIKHWREGISHFWTILSLNTRFLIISKSASLLDSTAHI